MSFAAIDEPAVRAVLLAIRHAQPYEDSPLLQLRLVSVRLAAEGAPDTVSGRAWVLARLLDQLVREALGRLRGDAQPAGDSVLSPADELALLRADFQSEAPARQALGLLRFRYLSSGFLPMGEAAAFLGTHRRTLERRLARGHLLLADLLRERELPLRDRERPQPGDSAGAGWPLSAAHHTRLDTGPDARAADRAAPDDAADAVASPAATPALAALLAAAAADGDLAAPAAAALRSLEGRSGGWTAHRVERIAAWSQERFRLDRRFVSLSLLVDHGEQAAGGRWQAHRERHDDLFRLLAELPDPALVILGPPGSGKSTLLRRLELDLAVEGLRADTRPQAPAASGAGTGLTFFIQLNQYRSEAAGLEPPAPGRWLAARWTERFPGLPPLDALLRDGRMVLLLDALNEMPCSGPRQFHQRVARWKDWLVQLQQTTPGNRVLFSCRSLDYSAPLSSGALRVPQLRVEPMADEQVAALLQRVLGRRGDRVWEQIRGSAELEALRSPFFLSLLAQQAAADEAVVPHRVGLLTDFVRRALRREVEQGHPLFLPEDLLDERDLRRLAQWRWQDAVELPERGPLMPGLARLAYGMQLEGDAGAGAQRRISLDGAEALIDLPQAGDILRAGLALDVLDEDPAVEDLCFRHQLFQEYFAARCLVRAPRADLVAAPWREAEVAPGATELLAGLPPGEALPPLPQTGWEETTLLAAAMAPDPAAFLWPLMAANLALTGRAAATPLLRERLPEAFLQTLREALMARSRDPAADLRSRIAAAMALGPLGDPRFPLDSGPEGPYRRPALVAIAGGDYPIGDDDPVVWLERETRSHLPRHTVRLGPFQIGRYPVTNAEWGCFMTAGGYEDARWWDTAAGRRWREGRGTAAGIHADIREWLARFRGRPEFLAELVASGQLDDEAGERWRRRLAMSATALELHLGEAYPEQRLTAPRYWRDERFNGPSQPVVGICWYEARAYCSWLSAQSGMTVGLPTEAEWEAAARGLPARRYAGGDAFHPLMGNTAETRLRQTSPVGVFPAGDTPEGVGDLTGNVFEWTASLLGEDSVQPRFGYPYHAGDGRENPDAAPEVLRVGRGGSWYYTHPYARAASRDFALPAIWNYNSGFRLAVSGGSGS